MGDWHTLDREALLRRLDSRPEGLTDAEAAERLERLGPNQLQERHGRSPLAVFAGQFTEVMVLVLLAAAGISFAIGEMTDAIMILIIVALNAVLGFTQEYRAERAMAALKRLSVPTVRVRRSGQVREVQATQLVPGDLFLLEAGNRVSADARLLEAINLRVDEAALTGESAPVEKTDQPVAGESIPLGDRRNLAYMGTVVTYGRGSAVVVQTGMNTELGHIADMLQTVAQEKTPLQRRMAELGKWLALGALVIVAIVFAVGLWRGGSLTEMFLSRAGVKPRIAMEISSNETIKQAVVAGLGIALISVHTIGAEMEMQRLAILAVEGLPAWR